MPVSYQAKILQHISSFFPKANPAQYTLLISLKFVDLKSKRDTKDLSKEALEISTVDKDL